MLPNLTNLELSNEMVRLTKRYGELSLWIATADQKIFNMIQENRQLQMDIARELKLKHEADIERYIILSDLKKVELEMDRRVEGEGMRQ